MGSGRKDAPISFTGMLGAERKDPDESTFNHAMLALPQFLGEWSTVDHDGFAA
jgi:hypothetical protein